MKKTIVLLSCFCLFLTPLLHAKKKGEAEFSYKNLKTPQKIIYLGNLLMSGQEQEALRLFLESHKLKLDEKSKVRLQFMQGYIALLQDNPKQAQEIFKQLQGKYKEMDPILPYWLARSQRLSGKNSEALQSLEKICGGPCDSNTTASARVLREYASALCSSGDFEKGKKLFDELITNQKRELDKEYARLDFVECLKNSGKTEEAYQQLQNSYVQAQGGIAESYLQKLLKELHEKDGKIPNEFSVSDSISRINQLKSQDRFVDAADDYKNLWGKIDTSSQQNYLTDAAETFFKARYYKDSAERYAELVKSAADSNLKIEWLQKLASAYARSNQFEKAIASQKEIASLIPSESSKIDWKIAFLYYDAGQCEKAVDAFDQYMQAYPASSKNEEAQWRKAWCLAQLKKYNESIRELEGLDKAYPKRVAYWRMRWLEESGQKDELKNAKSVLQSQAAGFYARWDDLVRDTHQHQCPQVNPFKILSKNDSPPKLPVTSSEQEKTLKELLILGLWEDFLDYYGPQNSRGDIPKDQLDDWVQFFAYVEQIPPELIWAVMKEESHFNPKALSPVGAMGLMQIIPQTGYEIAEDLNLSTYSTDDLMKPLINVRFGSHYLSKLNRQFSGNLIQTIAAYNAGPLAVERWSTQNQNQACDEFIEEIPYKETYNYVMKVMQSFWNYQRSGNL